jgi:hypothetical protein
MKLGDIVKKTIFAGIGTLALIGGLAACGTTPAAAPAARVTVTAPASSSAPATPSATPTTATPTASSPGTTIIINNNPAPVNTPAPAVAYPAGSFQDVQNLANSVAAEQAAELTAAPADDYESADGAQVSVNLTPIGYDTYSVTGSDTDGDYGSGDTVTVIDGGNAWADTGMNWSGPDIYIYGGVTNYWTTPAQADWQS